MARKRSLPTTLFASPDFFELSSNTARLIFIGLILDADDEGRGSAHPRLLARKLDQEPAAIEQALEELATHGMVQCYEVAGRRLYWLCHWHRYQTLSKPTPSHFPPPPDQESSAQEPQASRDGNQRLPAKERSVSTNLPTVTADSTPALVTQVASALYLPESEALRQVVQEFSTSPALSLLGEAIEAHAWIEDRRRNTRRQLMTPAFFRRWLRRSQHTAANPSSSFVHMKKDAADTTEHEPDQYEIYIKALQAKYNDHQELQEVS